MSKITDTDRCRDAIEHLKKARDLLKEAGAKRTVARIRDTINSAEGALRHAENRSARVPSVPAISSGLPLS